MEKGNKTRQKKKNMSLFIDGENISFRKAERIMEIVQKEGELYSSRVYGLQNDKRTKKWTAKAKELNMKDIRLYGGPAKDKVDKKLQKDILKEIQKEKNVDIICIVSSDHGYVSAIELAKKYKKRVIGLGEKNTSVKLREVCNKFIEI